MWMYQGTGFTRSFIACLIQSLFPPRKILVLIFFSYHTLNFEAELPFEIN